jgi:hypothetical protein
MDVRPPGAPLDAFFAPVRRRHPDVDIVPLPTSTPSTEDTLDEAQVAATLDRVASTARRMWEVAFPDAPPPTGRWHFGPAEGTVVAWARSAATTPAGFAVLVALREFLEAEDWQVRRLPGAIERVAAAREDLRLEASYAESTGAFLLGVRSAPSHVGSAPARRLVRQ